MHSTVNHAAGQLYLFCGKNKDHIKFNIIYNMAKLLASSYLGTTILGAQTPKKKEITSSHPTFFAPGFIFSNSLG